MGVDLARIVALIVALLASMATVRAEDFTASFRDQNDRIWVGPRFWANPMEDWRLDSGRLECISAAPGRNVQVLTHELSAGDGDLETSVTVGLIEKLGVGSAGFRIGIQDEIDDYRARLIYGVGLNAGLTTEGVLFVGDKSIKSPNPIDWKKPQTLTLTAKQIGDESRVRLVLNGAEPGVETVVPASRMHGNLAIVNNHFGVGKAKKGKKEGDGPGARFWFQDWKISGSKVAEHPTRTYGPVLFSTYTLSRGVLKMLAHLPPVGANDNQSVDLQIKSGDTWKTIATAPIEPMSRTAQFRVTAFNDSIDHPYRLVYTMKTRDGKESPATYDGVVRKDPAHDKTSLVMAAFTGNADYGFPNLEIVRNLKHQNPDLLFFSGDNIYEYVGGFPLIRTPPDRAILNYLRKWHLVGLAFGDLTRDRPSIFLPDDHDVYQGNIWGNGGNPITLAEHERGGYVQHRDFVNVVHRTQCGNLPDPYDPTPLQQNISVYYCDMVYGRVGFAVIADRMFKSGPKGTVTNWGGRPDHLTDSKIDPRTLDKPGLHLLGDRQEQFLKEWGRDWKGVNMKSVLSQTIFCNLANYHGPKQEYLVADLDSGGWPQSGRNRALDLMRRCFAVHVAGDQHLASLVHHGIDAPADANWSFCVPSIANFYPRSWQPDKEGLPVQNRPDPKLLNTGDYLDGFKNHIRVHGVGNPEPTYRKGRLPSLHDKASGYGVVRFDTKTRKITMECYKLLVDVSKPAADHQFPGWPKTIDMLDNFDPPGAKALPMIECRGMSDPVVQVIDEKSKNVVFTVRAIGDSFRPKVVGPGPFTIRVGNPGTDAMRTFPGVTPGDNTKLLADFTGK